MRSAIGRLQSVLQRSLLEQSQTVQMGVTLPPLSDLQQLVAAAALVGCSSSSTPWSSSQWGSVRCMSRAPHKLSLKKANNKASWLAVQPFLQQQEEQPDSSSDQLLQQRQSQIVQTAIPPLPVLDEPMLYQRIGRITGPYRVGPQVGAGMRCHDGVVGIPAL